MQPLPRGFKRAHFLRHSPWRVHQIPSGRLLLELLDHTVRRCGDIWYGRLPDRLDRRRQCGHGHGLVPNDH